MTIQEIPRDPLQRFIKLYAALEKDRRFWGDASSLRFAAIAALTCRGEPEELARSLRGTADDVKRISGWFGSLSSPLRFIVSAILTGNGDTAKGFLEEVDRVRKMFREKRLRRGGIYETMAILVLRQRQDMQPITHRILDRFRAIYEEMKRHHWWLTGPDDFPACALLVAEKESPQEIGEKIEAIYKALHSAGFSSGDPLQTAANILYLAREDARTLARRYRELAEGFRSRRVSIWQSDYDELAILSFLRNPASQVVERVLEHRAEMEKLRPQPDRSLTFNLAASTALLELVQADAGFKAVTEAKPLMDMQAIIAAQQAASLAAASSAAAAANASSSS